MKFILLLSVILAASAQQYDESDFQQATPVVRRNFRTRTKGRTFSSPSTQRSNEIAPDIPDYRLSPLPVEPSYINRVRRPIVRPTPLVTFNSEPRLAPIIPPPVQPAPINLTPRPVIEEDLEDVSPEQSVEQESNELETAHPIFLGPTPSPTPVPAAVIISRPQHLQPTVFRSSKPAFKPTPLPPQPQPVTSRSQLRQPAKPTPAAQVQYSNDQYNRRRQEEPVRATQQLNSYERQLVEEPRYSRPQPIKQTYQQPKTKYAKTEKKPVAQVIRKYREDNPDGSITWGYENSDGSFKEETIGADCIVRGKYGYVDPDGVKREYTYNSGIPCNKDEENFEEEEGYIDYQENKYVLPNGQAISLDKMIKNKARKPIYRN